MSWLFSRFRRWTMQATRFDTVTRALALRRRSRRAALGNGGASFAVTALAAAGVVTGVTTAAQEAEAATLGADEERYHLPELLFLQTFQGGTIEPAEGAEGRYTVTLAGGTGQTIYF